MQLIGRPTVQLLGRPEAIAASRLSCVQRLSFWDGQKIGSTSLAQHVEIANVVIGVDSRC